MPQWMCYHQIDKCIMPKEGIFAQVIHGRFVRAGDTIMSYGFGLKEEDENN